MEISIQQDYRMSFTLEAPCFAELHLTARSESDWCRTNGESALLQLTLNDIYNQDIVLFYGNRPLVYPRGLGWLEPGSYELKLSWHPASSPEVRRAFIEEARIERIAPDHPLAPVYRHLPILYGRNLSHPYESRFTDTPLLMFYTLTEKPVSTTIEYHIIYSHEDAGTPAPLLLSKWGRLTDIEWTYRVVLDAEGVVQEAVYQGPHHVTSRFRGLYGLGGLPMLQAATDNGMVTDIPDSSYRFLLAPVMRWEPHREPRERIMDAFPFTYPMMAWEALRHERPEVPANPATTALADPRCYLYVQTSKMTGRPEQNQGTSIDIRVKLKDDDRWYSSSFGDLRLDGFRAAYDGPYPQFSTTVKLYDGIALNRIERIEAVLLPGGADAVTVKGLKAFFLGPDYLPERPLIVEGEWKLSRRRPSAPLWQALQPV